MVIENTTFDENLYYAQVEWVEAQGLAYKDIMEDKNGMFILEEGENGFEKVYLPEPLNRNYHA